MEKIKSILQTLDGVTLTELEGGYFICFCPDEEGAIAPEACYLKQIGDSVQIFRDSAMKKTSLYESIIIGENIEPDENFSLETLQKMNSEQLYVQIIGG